MERKKRVVERRGREASGTENVFINFSDATGSLAVVYEGALGQLQCCDGRCNFLKVGHQKLFIFYLLGL